MVSLSCSEVSIATGRKRTQSCVRFLCKETGDGGGKGEGGTVTEENSAVDLLDMIKERCPCVSTSKWCPVLCLPNFNVGQVTLGKKGEIRMHL
jgi:hypothetical protein